MISRNTNKILGCKTGNLDLCVFKGDSFNEEINWIRNVNNKEVPVKLRGYSATMDFISAHNSRNELVLRLESPTGIYLDDDKIIINIPFQVIENFNWVKSNYRLIMTSPQGIKQTILRGRFIINGVFPGCC